MIAQTLNGPATADTARGPDHRRNPVAAFKSTRVKLSPADAKALAKVLDRRAIPERMVLRSSDAVWDRNPERAARLECLEGLVFRLEAMAR
jgi:hypothetical protein